MIGRKPMQLAISLTAVFPVQADTIDESIAWMAAPATTVPCDTSPFGRYVDVGQNSELVLTQVGSTTAADYIRSYQQTFAEEHAGVLRNNAGFGSTTTFLTGTHVDLDGDGRDEIVHLGRKADGSLLVAVFQPNGAALDLIDTWTIAGTISTPVANTKQKGALVVAGDFDGSKDGREEIAVLARAGSAPLNVKVYLLSGAANGAIAQADSATLATWQFTGDASNVLSGNIGLTSADLLFTGRDQVLVADEINPTNGATHAIVYHLLEFEGGTFNSFLNGGTISPGFASARYDDLFNQAIDGFSIDDNGIRELEVDAGDVLASPQAELVLHVQAKDPGNSYIIAQRLYRFKTTRNANNEITAINFVTLDTQRAQESSDSFDWEADIGNIDSVSPAEIVIARALPGTNREFRVEGYKATRIGAGEDDWRIVDAPTYDASYLSAFADSTDMRRVQIDTADLNGDAIGDVITVHQEPDGTSAGKLVLVRWALGPTLDPITFAGTPQPIPLTTSNIGLELSAADLDGDSVIGRVGTDCRRINEPQVRALVWWPPYFETLQSANSALEASFGQSTQTGATQESTFGSYTSHAITGYLGASVEAEISGIGASASARVTASASYQATRGEIAGSEISTTRGEGFSQSQGEGLLVVERNTFDCFVFNLGQQGGQISGDLGKIRMCERLEEGRQVSGTDSTTWDTFAAQQVEGGTPAQWVPLHHEWANIALFKDVQSNTTNVFGAPPNIVTDGQYTSSYATFPFDRPYLQIDLGSVQPITNIRVFPRPGKSSSLAGFRLYLSEDAMVGNDPPAGAGVAEFAPGVAADFGYDRWNAHTRDANRQPIQARYVRLQKPTGEGELFIEEFQVFSDVHVEPNRYPQAVCDGTPNDNLHKARIWDASTRQFRMIDVRGDLMWNGSPTNDPACSAYHSGVSNGLIWGNLLIGDTATAYWELSSELTDYIGQFTSMDANVGVGAEFDVSGGFIAQVRLGGGYEFTAGITEDTQSTTYWTSGLDIGGAVGGFSDNSLVTACGYRAHPYGVRLVERSNTGYLHTLHLVDYVVRESAGVSGWTRANIPDACLGIVRPDPIFESGFE